jgi:hypothetical protein
MPHLDLTDDEAAALTQELHDIVENDRYPFSPRIRTLRGILAKLRPEPVRKSLPPPKVYAPPRATLARKHRAGRPADDARQSIRLLLVLAARRRIRRTWR